MKAMILAAGLGKRMRPLTDHVPKPLLEAGGRRLIDFHLEALSASGFSDVSINTHWLAEQIPQALSTGERWGLKLHYSYEDELLETAGGVRKVLSHLESESDAPFLLLNGDIYCEFDLPHWLNNAQTVISDKAACLGLVNNPEQHPEGDFDYDADSGLLLPKTQSPKQSYTYAGIALYRPSFFRHLPYGPAPLAPLLHKGVSEGNIGGVLIHDYWSDIGTPDRLASLQERLS